MKQTVILTIFAIAYWIAVFTYSIMLAWYIGVFWSAVLFGTSFVAYIKLINWVFKEEV